MGQTKQYLLSVCFGCWVLELDTRRCASEDIGLQEGGLLEPTSILRGLGLLHLYTYLRHVSIYVTVGCDVLIDGLVFIACISVLHLVVQVLSFEI